MSGDGIFGSAYQSPTVYPGDSQATAEAGVGGPGGRTISCPKGVYWAQQPLASLGPCADIAGSTKFRLSDGTEVTNTADLTRGYKAGYDIIQTAGIKGESTAGDGGNGATGGHGGTHLGGAGGGSGYTDGSVTIVDTQLGGSNGNSKVVIRLAV